ncbi:hypothetical protein RND81_10G231700 [Saponaria officinalis]|uniref:Uncharacterized protein n=1 Tax=Saponaria officinalis TaxID=3572 RepID=A0AAW1I780_SAPOF
MAKTFFVTFVMILMFLMTSGINGARPEKVEMQYAKVESQIGNGACYTEPVGCFAFNCQRTCGSARFTCAEQLCCCH